MEPRIYFVVNVDSDPDPEDTPRNDSAVLRKYDLMERVVRVAVSERSPQPGSRGAPEADGALPIVEAWPSSHTATGLRSHSIVAGSPNAGSFSAPRRRSPERQPRRHRRRLQRP